MAKLGSFPAWPSLIVPIAHLPSKPKKKFNIPLATKSKVPVYFFGEANYAAVPAKNIRLLKPEDQDLAKSTVKDQDKKLYAEAIEETLAYSYPESYIEILKDQGVIDEDSAFVEWESLVTPSVEEAPNKTAKANGKRRSVAEVASKATAGTKKKRMVPKLDDPEEDTEAIKARLHNFRYKIQKGLIQRNDEPSESELEACSQYLTDVQEFSPKMNAELLGYSKLHKVMRAILKLPHLEDKHDFHKRAGDLLIDWSDIILELKPDRQRTDTPNSSLLEATEPKDEVKGDQSDESSAQLPKVEVKEDADESTAQESTSSETSKSANSEETKELKFDVNVETKSEPTTTDTAHANGESTRTTA